ncbi:MAG: type II toxin-antitoxin system Phd/YefM family antitoxin [Rickettsiales bacterium]|jgi:PHD/YefM family antitoxin component YafN of YafNO toxin-antitoxin module|nr:type II toxin-antitoxin system Phd/YefM family antitoxin [Rickettsiales bacterium]
MNVIQDVRPISDFVKSAGMLLDSVKETKRPMFITKNGVIDGVVLDPHSYQQLIDSQEQAVLHDIHAALRDIEAGRTTPYEQSFDRIRKKYGFGE